MPWFRRSGRSVVIIGAGNGLSREIALRLAGSGYIVFGTAAASVETEEVRRASHGRVSLVVCDLRNREAITAWADGVSEAVGKAGIDLLISMTERLASGPVEFLPLDAIRLEFEVNVFGGLAVINAFLPALRTARGRIVQIGSWMASMPLPYGGPSEASHAAMEVFAAVYRAELKPFGIDVVVISHDNLLTQTDTVTAALARSVASMTAEQRRLYGKTIGAFAETFGSTQTDEIDPSAVAARLVEIVEQRPAPIRAAIGSQAERQLNSVWAKPAAEPDALS